jgi:hypothetical protein
MGPQNFDQTLRGEGDQDLFRYLRTFQAELPAVPLPDNFGSHAPDHAPALVRVESTVAPKEGLVNNHLRTLPQALPMPMQLAPPPQIPGMPVAPQPLSFGTVQPATAPVNITNVLPESLLKAPVFGQQQAPRPMPDLPIIMQSATMISPIRTGYNNAPSVETSTFLSTDSDTSTMSTPISFSPIDSPATNKKKKKPSKMKLRAVMALAMQRAQIQNEDGTVDATGARTETLPGPLTSMTSEEIPDSAPPTPSRGQHDDVITPEIQFSLATSLNATLEEEPQAPEVDPEVERKKAARLARMAKAAERKRDREEAAQESSGPQGSPDFGAQGLPDFTTSAQVAAPGLDRKSSWQNRSRSSTKFPLDDSDSDDVGLTALLGAGRRQTRNASETRGRQEDLRSRKWDTTPLVSPLSLAARTTEQRVKMSKKLFDRILAIMGDRTSNNSSDKHLKVLVNDGIANPWFHEEIYRQTLKQVNENPSHERTHKGWDILYVCATAFVPQDSHARADILFCIDRHLRECKENRSNMGEAMRLSMTYNIERAQTAFSMMKPEHNRLDSMTKGEIMGIINDAGNSDRTTLRNLNRNRTLNRSSSRPSSFSSH